MNVVFTGPAFDGSGKSIVRDDLIAACVHAGIGVQSSVKPSTTLLVASRADTVKARGAASRGVVVIDYPTFIAQHLGGAKIEACAKPNRWTDNLVKTVKAISQVPDFTAEYGLAPEHIL